MFHFFRGNFLRDLKLKDRLGVGWSWLWNQGIWKELF